MIDLCVDIETSGLNFFELRNPDDRHVAVPEFDPESRITAIGFKNLELHDAYVSLSDEKLVVKNFLHLFSSLSNSSTVRIVGYNVRNFDVPFIFYRAVKHGLDLGSFKTLIRGYENYRNPYIVDLYNFLRFNIFKNNFKLSAVLKSWDMEGKYEGFDGKDATTLDAPTLRKYVMQDVKIEWDLYRKLKEVGVL